MDHRWEETPLDSRRDARVILHPLASVVQVRRQVATDGVDLTPMLESASHSAFECQVSLRWNYELFGTQNQPRPNQVIEIQAQQNNLYSPLWIGIVESISAYTISRGERSMTLTARTRDSLDQFRTAKRVTPQYPGMTNLDYIAQRVAENVGLELDEVVLPSTAIMTNHTNTQLADMSAWEMFETLFMPVGWTPFIDSIGRLRAANRSVQNIESSVVLTPERVKKVVANRARGPVSRVRVKWLDPVLKKTRRQQQKLAGEAITFGWYLRSWTRKVYFSDDETQRAEKTEIYWKRSDSANAFFGMGFVTETYTQLTENEGEIHLHNKAWEATLVAMLAGWLLMREGKEAVWRSHTHLVVSGIGAGYTLPSAELQPTSALRDNIILAFIVGLMMMVTNGYYEIWGFPFEWTHARNTTEAFNTAVQRWVDTPEDIESDFVMNEQHAQAFAVRELVYRAWSANKWSVEIADDYRIEFGDVIEMPDGSRMYVEDFSRKLSRGDEAILQVSGFILGVQGQIGRIVEGPVPEETPDGTTPGVPGVPGTPPGTPTPPTTPGTPTPPATGSGACPERTKSVPLYNGAGIVNDYARAHPDQLNNSCQNSGGSWAFMDGCVAALRAADSRFGYNGKRGNAGDLSHDAISYYCGPGSPTHGSKDVYVIDIIGGHCGGDPGPAWIDQSRPEQACGAWVASR